MVACLTSCLLNWWAISTEFKKKPFNICSLSWCFWWFEPTLCKLMKIQEVLGWDPSFSHKISYIYETKSFSKRGQVTNSQNMGNLDFVTSWTPQGLPSETSPHNATGKDHNPRDCLAGEPGMWAAKAYKIIKVANFATTSKWRWMTFHRLNLHPQSRLADR